MAVCLCYRTKAPSSAQELSQTEEHEGCRSELGAAVLLGGDARTQAHVSQQSWL